MSVLEGKIGLDRMKIKWIALITMLIDHIGYAVSWQVPYEIWHNMRIVGRISFPLYCFLLVEGSVIFPQNNMRVSVCCCILEENDGGAARGRYYRSGGH